MRFPEIALTEGVDEHLIDGVPVRITGVARTVADCFKYRNKIGLDVALEALKESLGTNGQGRRATMDDLWYFARLCRVANVMRPYLEILAGPDLAGFVRASVPTAEKADGGLMLTRSDRQPWHRPE